MQELQDVQRSLQAITAERDGLLQQSRAEVGRYVEEVTVRKQHQEALARALTRREAEIATMRVQVGFSNSSLDGVKCCVSLLCTQSQFCILQINNHRLGTIVQKFSGSVAEGAVDSFEPAFAYHQLQQVCLHFPENRDLVM